MGRPGRPKTVNAPEAEGITFFGEVDRDRMGNIKSAYPAYYNQQMVEDLETEVNEMEAAVEKGLISNSDMPYHKKRLEEKKERLEMIEDSRPKLDGTRKDRVANEYKELKEKIRESMFTEYDMKKGFANPHEEARRMKKPCIKVDAELAKSCGVNVDRNGMVSRDGASKMFQIMGRSLGENTMVEKLRRDRITS